jgi:hypothetical protein
MPDEDVDLLVIEGEARSVDEACVADSMCEDPSLGPSYQRAVELRCRHFERLGVRRLVDTLCIVRRRAQERPWTTTVPVAPLREARVTRAHVDSLIAANDLLARGDEALLSARVRLPAGTAFVGGEDGVVAHFRRSCLHATAALDGGARDVLKLVDASRDVGSAIARLAEQLRASRGAVRERALPVIAHALRTGLLVVDGQGGSE